MKKHSLKILNYVLIPTQHNAWRHYVISAALVIGITLVSWLLITTLHISETHSFNLLFFIPVFFASVFYRLPVAVFTVVLAILLFDMVITPPYWQLEPWKPENIINFLAMILTAVSVASVKKIRLLAAQNKKMEDEQKQALLSAMLSSISHDFKTPLVTVIGALSSLKEMQSYGNEDHCRQLVGSALEEAEKLKRFIGNLLEISRLEAGIPIAHKEPISLRDLLASPLKSLRHLIKNQKIVMDIEPHFPLLNVNQPLMELVFLNLLENAVKYGAGEDGMISVNVVWNGQTATIDIEDNGPGIAEEDRESVFTKFYRGAEGDRKVGGTGLGLYICRAIVEAHGGNIGISNSERHGGARVQIVLPAATLISSLYPEEESEAV